MVYKCSKDRLNDYNSNFVQQAVEKIRKEHKKSVDIMFIPKKLLLTFYRCGYNECVFNADDLDSIPTQKELLASILSDMPADEKVSIVTQQNNGTEFRGIEISRPSTLDTHYYIHYGKLCKELGIK